MTDVIHAMPAQSTTAIVAFTAWDSRSDRHNFFKVLQPLSVTKLLVRDPAQEWFNSGLPGLGDDVEGIAEHLREEVAHLGATRVVTLGASMGGYAAILFGCLLGAERVIALAPQTLVAAELQPRFLRPDFVPEVSDLVPVIQENPGTKVDLVAGWDDHADVFHAQRVAGLGSLRVLAMPGRTHDLAAELDSAGQLLPLIVELLDGRTPAGCEVNPKLDPEVEARIADAFVAERKREWAAVVERIGPVAERHQDWPGPNLALGRGLAGLGRLEEAAVALTRAVRPNPRWFPPRKELTDVLAELGREKEAEAAKREGLAIEIRGRLGPTPELERWPLVSIIVVNRDGEEHLQRLMAGLAERTEYPDLELILVDNRSGDGSVEFMQSIAAPFPITILTNPHNASFSDANNQGAESASGELLLFLNNDVEPFESGWLRELVACHRRSEAGAVAATLICPDDEHERRFPRGYGVQHRGLLLADDEEDDRRRPRLRGWEENPLDQHLGQDAECEAVAAACMLVDAADYQTVGGFTHGYFYGCEDVDLCLKLRTAGRSIVCSGRSIAIHHPVSTRRRTPFEEARKIKEANLRLLWERWGPLLVTAQGTDE